jgi:putative FmdB family regulatory protein
MPTYDYRCDACGHRFELFQSIKADPAKTCPSCGQDAARRMIGTGGGLIFKGSGFYITDYRSESYKTAAKSETGGGPSTGAATGASATPAPASAPAGSSGAGGAAKGEGGGGASAKTSTAAA